MQASRGRAGHWAAPAPVPRAAAAQPPPSPAAPSHAALPLPRLAAPAVAVVLGFVGGKILAEFAGYHVSTEASLGVVAGALTLGVVASLLSPEKGKGEGQQQG